MAKFTLRNALRDAGVIHGQFLLDQIEAERAAYYRGFRIGFRAGMRQGRKPNSKWGRSP